jgi:glycosyltransferase involved in cell wall biosynthesis
MAIDRWRGKKIVVFSISAAGFVQFILPLYRELVRRGKPTAFYLSPDYPMKKELSVFQLSSWRYIPARIARYFFLTDIYIEPEIMCRGPKSAIRIMIGHGQPVKVSNWAENDLRSFNVYFLYGPLERELFELIKSEKPASTAHIRLVDVGYPKLDDLLQGRYRREEVLSSLGLNTAWKTVIYAPAWDPNGSLRKYGEKVIKALLAIPDVNVIVKLHPVSLEPSNSPNYTFYTGGVNWVERFKPFEKLPNFRHVADYLVDPLLAAADVMVTDFSGVALEFMTQDRPVVYIDCPEFFEKTLREWRQDPDISKNDDRLNAGRNAGLVVKDPSELAAAVRRSLNNPEEFSGKRKTLAARFLYNPGRGASTAAEEILKLLGL